MTSLLNVLAGDVDIRSDVRTVGGIEMHARRAGDPGRPPVVLVHGMIVSSRYFVPTMRELAAVADVWAPDLLGHGRTQRPPGPLSVAALAGNLLDWMADVGLPPAVLVGNSFGCQTVVEAAVRAPERIRALVLNGPTTDPQARSAPAQILRWLRTSTNESLVQTPLLVRDYLEFGPSRIGSMVATVLDDAIEDKLPQVSQPTVVFCGTEDAIVPQDWAEEVVRLLPDGRLVMVPDAAHTLNFTHPSELANIVSNLLEAA